MDEILKKLQQYLDNTSEGDLRREWEEKSYLDEIGPDVTEYFKYVTEYTSSLTQDNFTSKQLNHEDSINFESEYFYAA